MFGWGRTIGLGRNGATLAVALLISVTAGGCTVSSATPAATPFESPAATRSSGPAAPTAGATPTVAASPTVAPVVSPSTVQPAAGPLVDGMWAGIRWISDGKPAPDPSAAEDLVKPTPGLTVDTFRSIFGWSKGYVGFQVTQFTRDDSMDWPTYSIVAESSTNGLQWKTGSLLANLGEVGGIGRVVEGPGGLLALGYGPAATCGPPPTLSGIWKSADGTAWTSVKMPFGKDSIYTIDAGSAGYIAMGVHSSGEPALWTSKDGTTWAGSASPVSSKTGSIQDGTAFSGGFVIVGATRGEEGCGAGAVKPSVWWSADGKTWARQTLPAVPAAADSWMSVSRLADDLLLATASTNDVATQETTTTSWSSGDGRTWRQIQLPKSVGNFMTNGSRAIAENFDDKSNRHFWAFEPDGSTRELTQTGSLPPSADYSAQFALGPAGLLMLVDEGNRFFLGVPTN